MLPNRERFDHRCRGILWRRGTHTHISRSNKLAKNVQQIDASICGHAGDCIRHYSRVVWHSFESYLVNYVVGHPVERIGVCNVWDVSDWGRRYRFHSRPTKFCKTRTGQEAGDNCSDDDRHCDEKGGPHTQQEDKAHHDRPAQLSTGL